MNLSKIPTNAKRNISFAAILAMLATLFGAFSSHVFRENFSDLQMMIFQTAVFYQFIHSFALLFIGLLLIHVQGKLLVIASWLFMIGIVLFSGSLYLMSLFQIKVFGIATPFGGMGFILGWLFLAIGIYRADCRTT